MPLQDGFGLLQRLIIWVSITPTATVMQAELPDILADIRQMHPKNPVLGTVEEVWDGLLQMDEEDSELGELTQWRAFVLLSRGYDDGIVTDPDRMPNAIRFICPRAAWAPTNE